MAQNGTYEGTLSHKMAEIVGHNKATLLDTVET